MIIGPTRPVCSPEASGKPPMRATGVHPVWMKNAVMKPQAMNAAMFGMIIPDRNVPNFCTATRLLLVLLAGAASVLTTDPLPRAGRVQFGPRGMPAWPTPGVPGWALDKQVKMIETRPGRRAGGDSGLNCGEL